MAKKSKASTASPAAVPQKTVDAKADIDDIFAKPSASTAALPVNVSTSSDTAAIVSKSKKKKSKAVPAADQLSGEPESSPPPTTTTKSKKRKSTDAAQTESSQPSNATASAPEVAVFSDPSAVSSKKQKTEVSGKPGKNKEQMVKDDEDERAFRDSRGDGPRE